MLLFFLPRLTMTESHIPNIKNTAAAVGVLKRNSAQREMESLRA
jgi:hypothetical protein